MGVLVGLWNTMLFFLHLLILSLRIVVSAEICYSGWFLCFISLTFFLIDVSPCNAGKWNVLGRHCISGEGAIARKL